MAKATVQEKIVVPLEFEEIDVRTSIQCGFRQEWIAAEGNGDAQFKSLDLSVGAGLGTPWGQVNVDLPNGERRIFRFDARELINRFVDQVFENGE